MPYIDRHPAPGTRHWHQKGERRVPNAESHRFTYFPAVSMLALLAVFALPIDTSALGPGVSHALATRRAAQISGVRYALTLDVTRHDTASGHVVVRFTRRAGGDLILDFRGPRIGDARANGRPVRAVANGAHIRIPASALVAGANVLEFDFASTIAPAGSSIIRFHDATDGADYLYTLLVPADANALFPCFDQPDLKARVTLALTVPRGWTAVANGALADSTAGATTTFRYRETEPISTYLIAFAAGPWTKIERTVGSRTIALYVRASRAREAEADTLIGLNARALEWLGRYFARPFPFAKFDVVLAPAFPFGGMEHPGAVFYNEESFIFRERPTLSQRIGRESTIFHEVAHQWFGDFVTMRWFDDLWLKEGFATYIAAKMQAELDSGAHAWKTFYLRNKPAAYAVDASDGTTPVWQALGNLDQAKSNYGAIVYNKAPGVLKQLNSLVGDKAFRAGLRDYLVRHAYGNATWRDLLDAVGRAAHRDLGEWGRQYIQRPGMPVISQDVARQANGVVAITLRQRAARPLSGTAPWPVKLQLVVWPASGAPVHLAAELTESVKRITMPAGTPAPAFVFANAGDDGYALVMLDTASVTWLELHIGEVGDDFLRAMLWGSMWDLVREARLAPSRYIAMAARAMPAERDEQLASGVLSRVSRATETLLSDAQRDSMLGGLERALAAGAADSSRVFGVRKAHLDALITVATSPAALSGLDSLLDRATAAGAPLRAPTRWAIVTALVERNYTTAERRLDAETVRDSTTEGKRRAFVAGAARPSAAVKADYFRRYFGDTELNEDWATASLRAFNAPRQSPLTMPYLAPALDTLGWIQKNRRIFFLGSWLGAFMDGQTSGEAQAIVAKWLARHPTAPRDLREKILQAEDDLRRAVRVRKRFADIQD
ncbi:MAG: M1 family aminopeptidase [Gemmatimonadaceae bacterium]